MGVQKTNRLAGVTRLAEQTQKGGERQMTYLIQVANQRPMLRVTAQIVLAFCCAAPLVLALSSLVAYGVHTTMH